MRKIPSSSYRDFKSFLSFASIFFLLAACQGEQPEPRSIDKASIAPLAIKNDVVIGSEDQPFKQQFGQPIAVRTDSVNNIYVADRASKTIKVYDRDGNYIQSLGRRGRGPGEFQEMELMELTPEGHLVLMDRGNFLYTIISTDGEYIDSFPYDFENQFYPEAISYVDGQILALFLYSDPDFNIPELERDLFHVYSADFQDAQYSFAPFHRLDIEDMYGWVEMTWNTGSFTVAANQQEFIFAPSIYNGILYTYKRETDNRWEFDKTLQGIQPQVEPYKTFSTEEEFEASSHLPGAFSSYYGSLTPHVGRILSSDLGIFHLNDGRVVHFWGERRENEEFEFDTDLEYHFLDIHAQVFNEQGKVEYYGEILTLEEPQFFRPMNSMVNWKDSKDNFYLIDQSANQVPVVRRFSLELED